MLQIYCGNGKGKTTASVGAAVRAAGAGLKTAFIQFLKSGTSSEIAMLERLPGITVLYASVCDKFTFQMNDEEKAEVRRCHDRLLAHAGKLLSEGLDVLILDEFNAAYKLGLMDRTSAAELILSNKNNAEIIITGREPAPEFTEAADYISEIAAVKHPYENGTAARKGIEY
ncbi:MAG: cob(I)yrinic acid a,c-diamide adenosyltransferase [Ruminococcus sp.]|nr:cob(I)yrinic acid a,c-diamide adenosyltransferase [Ruminococcus sp.]